MPVSSPLPLFIRINDYLERIEYSMQKAEKIIAAEGESSSDLSGIILEATLGRALHDVYSAYEKIFEDIADEIDGGKPNGDAWHQKLLQQMRPKTAYRPAVIPQDLHATFDDLRGFRHVYRGSYGSDLRVPDMLSKYASVRDDVIPGMLESLQALSNHLEDPFVAPEEGDDGPSKP
ncbi:hypothetical protein KUV57_13690 [Epibacterium sp. DP7N7-1]|nr:hypothetical protein [Epibacterium sp. DP7N7-1]